MAIDFSSRYVAESRRNLHWRLLLAIRYAPWIKRWRLLCFRLGSKRVYPSIVHPAITKSLEAAAAHFKANRWAYMEDIFSPDFYKELLANWPKRRYLEPPREVEKSYNMGFGWIGGYSRANDFTNCDPYHQHQTLLALLQYLRSPEVSRRITAFAGVPEELALYSFILTDAGTGAEVIPHKDSTSTDSRTKYALNLIFFIDASGGKNSGGLMLSRDNELKEIMFEPPNLRNTCLAYDILGDFYHGFPPIAPKKFRWVVTAQFCQKDYAQKSS